MTVLFHKFLCNHCSSLDSTSKFFLYWWQTLIFQFCHEERWVVLKNNSKIRPILKVFDSNLMQYFYSVRLWPVIDISPYLWYLELCCLAWNIMACLTPVNVIATFYKMQREPSIHTDQHGDSFSLWLQVIKHRMGQNGETLLLLKYKQLAGCGRVLL